jgi:hypothetical protein
MTISVEYQSLIQLIEGKVPADQWSSMLNQSLIQLIEGKVPNDQWPSVLNINL